MTDQSGPSQSQELPQATIRKRRWLSPVWAIPIVTAAIAGYLLYDFVFHSGPKISITFSNGENISKTATIRYRGVEVGKILSVKLNQDLKNVVVEARLAETAAGLARTNTKFWIVRPQISASGISGLSTIVSGAYITLDPGGGQPTTTFEGLNEPPEVPPEERGAIFILRGSTLHSASAGTPILYREIQVGQVVKADLSEDRSGVNIHAFVEAEYLPLVRKNSIFWNASGIHADFSVLNTTIDVESVSTLLQGGIAFANPKVAADAAEPGAVFDIHDREPPPYLVDPDESNLHLVLTASTAGAANVNDPIYYRQVEVGQVTHVDLSSDSQQVEIHVSIDSAYAPLVRVNSVFWNASGLHLTAGLFSGAKVDIESLESLVAGGIAFATPDQPGPRVKNGTVFALWPDGKAEWKAWVPEINVSPENLELAQNPAIVGTTRETMTKLQDALKKQGYYQYQIDGLYGPNTREALQAYQKANGLDVTGLPDEATSSALLK